MINNSEGAGDKKTWDDWSDFDVSNKITELKKQCFPGDNDFVTWDDYCHNPKAMWPIIVVNSISIIEPDSPNDKLWSAGRVYSASPWHSDKNPLRAAAIAFLMMKGVRPNA